MKRDIASDPMEIKMIIKELYKPLYVNKLDNLNNEVLERHNLPKLTQE